MSSYRDQLNAAFSKICELHAIDSLKDVQEFCLRQLVESKRDILTCLPTGFGKSLIFQAWPTVCQQLEGFPADPIVLVVCPLISIMEDQVKYLTEKGISAAYVGKHETTDANIAAGRFSLVFGSPELLVGVKRWRDMLQTDVYRERLIGLAVDEVHTVVLWGEQHGSDAPFRKWCGLVGELRSLLPVSLPVLALTATASLTTRKKIMKGLGLQKCLEVVKSPDRSNIRLAVKKVSSDPTKTFSWLVKELLVKGPQTARTVIYCKSISDCSTLFSDVFLASLGQKSVHPPGARNISSNRIVDMFHSKTSDSVKNHIIQALRDPQSVLRVVVATSALGMGVDFQNVKHIVQYGPPKDIESYMQAYGRAGRDGSMSYSLILYHGKHLIGISEKMRAYVTNDSSCRRMHLMNLFDGEVVQPLAIKHDCCDNCAKMCMCNDNCDGNASDLELHAAKPNAEKLRIVSKHQRESLRQMLMNRLEVDDVDHGLCSNISVYHTLQENCSTKDTIITETIQSCETLFCIDDIICRVPVYDLNQAKIILETVIYVFGDCESDMDSSSVDDSLNLSEFDAFSLNE